VAGAGGVAGKGGMGGASDCQRFPIPNPAGSGLPNPATYTDNKDGTITDDVTGLLWEQTDFTYNAGCPTGYCSNAAAAAHCATVGSGWRLPTRLELVTLVDFTIAPPALTMSTLFSAGTNNGAPYWTSTPAGGTTNSLFYGVHFTNAETYYYDANSAGAVRCVHSVAPPCSGERFVVTSDTVYDAGTGLYWQQAQSAPIGAWSDAQAYCATPWRLPSLTELQSIVDDKYALSGSAAIDPIAFPGTTTDWFWTSSAVVFSTGGGYPAWLVSFQSGVNNYATLTSGTTRVRCVR
jgi:hypothetical protein